MPDPQIRYAITLIRLIGKSRIGVLAETCAESLWSIADPLAIKVSLELPGLEAEIFEKGSKRYRSYLTDTLKDHNLEKLDKNKKYSRFITVSTEDDKILCIGTIRHMGNMVGFASAISHETDTGIIPLPEGLYFCASQLESRVHSILSPGSATSTEIYGRRLLKETEDIGVSAVAVGQPNFKEKVWVSLYRKDKEIRCSELDELPISELKSLKNGASLNENIIPMLWPKNTGIKSALWVTTQPGYLMAFGFEQQFKRETRTKIDEKLRDLTVDDIDHLIRSFEKLKSDFNKLIKSERAAAVTETAVTVNHEINNPLTAILGNTQLLLMAKDKLPKETVNKLRAIEKSAIKIRETTNKLMTIIEPVRTHYASGLDMIDIEKSKKKKS